MNWLKTVPWEYIIKITHLLLNSFWPGHCCKCLGCEGDNHVQAEA
jgi:hypothetical protein